MRGVAAGFCEGRERQSGGADGAFVEDIAAMRADSLVGGEGFGVVDEG